MDIPLAACRSVRLRAGGAVARSTGPPSVDLVAPSRAGRATRAPTPGIGDARGGSPREGDVAGHERARTTALYQSPAIIRHGMGGGAVRAPIDRPAPAPAAVRSRHCRAPNSRAPAPPRHGARSSARTRTASIKGVHGPCLPRAAMGPLRLCGVARQGGQPDPWIDPEHACARVKAIEENNGSAAVARPSVPGGPGIGVGGAPTTPAGSCAHRSH
uniref:Uncharacterized protein n=1 Tax=Setaria viridis TaxID=4556 RepID=A0A4U6TSD1_SETVI|nr:hypothetical protein SEVIR_7G186200v2 [Setaria viridis]